MKAVQRCRRGFCSGGAVGMRISAASEIGVVLLQRAGRAECVALIHSIGFSSIVTLFGCGTAHGLIAG